MSEGHQDISQDLVPSTKEERLAERLEAAAQTDSTPLAQRIQGLGGLFSEIRKPPTGSSGGSELQAALRSRQARAQQREPIGVSRDNPEPPKQKPPEGQRIGDRQEALEGELGIEFAALNESFIAGKIEKEIGSKADQLRKAARQEKLDALCEARMSAIEERAAEIASEQETVGDAQAQLMAAEEELIANYPAKIRDNPTYVGELKQLLEGKDTIVEELTQSIASKESIDLDSARTKALEQFEEQRIKAFRKAEGEANRELQSNASLQTPPAEAFEAEARRILRAQLSGVRGPQEMMDQYDEQGGRATIDAMLRDMVSENTLERMAEELATDGVDATEMKRRLVDVATKLFELISENEPMFPQSGIHSEAVKDVIGEEALAEIDEMGQYACLDADTFASSVNTEAGAHKFMLKKRLNDLAGRTDEHGDAVRAARSIGYNEDNLETAADSVQAAEGGVCQTLGMAAANSLLKKKQAGKMPKVKRIELFTGKARDGSAHSYVVLNRGEGASLDKPERWLTGECVLVDPWAGTIGCKVTYTEHRDYPSGLQKYIKENVKSEFDWPDA